MSTINVFYFLSVIHAYLQINPALSSLDFRRGRISAFGVSHLCAALCALSTSKFPQAVPHVRELNLGGNDIGDSGVESVCDLMRVSEWLQDLKLHECKISTQGAVSLGLALRASTSLQSLDLFYNTDIGLDGFISICAGLRVKSCIYILFISVNVIFLV